MRFLDLTLSSPEANLACDEALLDECEASAGTPILRLWEPDTYFVVVGYGQTASREVNQSACLIHDIPILRRCSGGGAVLQGPGCLNYALILEIESYPALESISAANRFIMHSHQKALAAVTGLPVRMEATTDLALDHRKFSGNAQRRKRRYLLFHGTFLLQFDLGRIQQFLRFPSRAPVYREERNHIDFLTCLSVDAAVVKTALCATWEATEATMDYPRARIEDLVATKYSRREWNLR